MEYWSNSPWGARRLACWLALCSGFGTACASSEDAEGSRNPSATPVATAALEGCAAVDLAPPKAGEGVQVSIELPLGPGEERQVCKLLKVGRALNLNWAEGRYSRGSHHGLVARTTYTGELPKQNLRGESVDAAQIADCESLNSDWDILSVIAAGHAVGASADTAPTAKGTLPDDVALKLEADDVLIVNFHMINLGDEPIRACYKQNLQGIPDAQVKQEAGTIFYYNPFIAVPAHSQSVASMACPVSHDVTLGSQVSHMHSRGVGYQATLLDGDPLLGGRELASLYETTEWDEPRVRVDSPRLELKQGQWIRWSCQYDNPSELNIAQGQQTTDEMCMFVGTYWPRTPEMDFCLDPQTQKSAARPLGTGTMNGSELLACYTQSPKQLSGGGSASSADRFATQRCVTESCPNASGRMGEFMAGQVDPNTIGCE